jgi:phytoene dehydrogenase-like protein
VCRSHHTLLFSRDWRQNFGAVFGRGDASRIPDPASLYVCRPSATDVTVVVGERGQLAVDAQQHEQGPRTRIAPPPPALGVGALRRGRGDASRIPDPASLYVCRPSATDVTVAPAGGENLFVLVPMPADPALGHGGVDGAGAPAIEAAADRVIAQIAEWCGPGPAHRPATRRGRPRNRRARSSGARGCGRRDRGCRSTRRSAR